MTVEAKTYSLMPNSKIITDSALAYVTILRLKREGLGYNSSGGDAPGDREYLHEKTTGLVEFLNPGIEILDPMATYDKTEKVKVIYKY